jgi:hypothetical protein
MQEGGEILAQRVEGADVLGGLRERRQLERDLQTDVGDLRHRNRVRRRDGRSVDRELSEPLLDRWRGQAVERIGRR